MNFDYWQSRSDALRAMADQDLLLDTTRCKCGADMEMQQACIDEDGNLETWFECPDCPCEGFVHNYDDRWPFAAVYQEREA